MGRALIFTAFRYLAVAETTMENKAIVTIYDLMHDGAKKRKVLSNSELAATEFISISFSPDSKYLAAQSSSPDWTLFLWVWEKNKLLTSARTCNPVQSCKIAYPSENWQTFFYFFDTKIEKKSKLWKFSSKSQNWEKRNIQMFLEISEWKKDIQI